MSRFSLGLLDFLEVLGDRYLTGIAIFVCSSSTTVSYFLLCPFPSEKIKSLCRGIEGTILNYHFED